MNIGVQISLRTCFQVFFGFFFFWEEKLGAIDFKDRVKLLRGRLGQRGPGFESGFTSLTCDSE